MRGPAYRHLGYIKKRLSDGVPQSTVAEELNLNKSWLSNIVRTYLPQFSNLAVRERYVAGMSVGLHHKETLAEIGRRIGLSTSATSNNMARWLGSVKDYVLDRLLVDSQTRLAVRLTMNNEGLYVLKQGSQTVVLTPTLSAMLLPHLEVHPEYNSAPVCHSIEGTTGYLYISSRPATTSARDRLATVIEGLVCRMSHAEIATILDVSVDTVQRLIKTHLTIVGESDNDVVAEDNIPSRVLEDACGNQGLLKRRDVADQARCAHRGGGVHHGGVDRPVLPRLALEVAGEDRPQ